jgi:uncharacterized protein (UPF0262 family)
MKKNNKTVLELHFQHKAQFKNLLIEREKEAAIADFMASHFFNCTSLDPPFIVHLEVSGQYIVFVVENTEDKIKINVPLMEFKKIIKDYFNICEAYYSALHSLKPDQLEAIDFGRRSLHNEGAQILIQQLEQKIHIDFETSRRLFTIICVSMIGKKWHLN